ncbi:MAG: TetR/AcrR family transcriptional regulator [Pseudomonadota bacterium]
MKKRGRPREFDEEAVVASMEALFWQQGLAATSLDDIAKTTGLNRPSLYSAFGSKVDMYLLCLNAFAKRMTDLFQAAFDQSNTLEDALNDLFSSLIATYYCESDKTFGLGCLVFSNAVVEAPTNERVQSMIESTLDVIRKSVRTSIIKRLPNVDEETLSMVTELSLSTFLGLGIQIRSGVNRVDIESSARNSVKAVGRLLA